MKIKTLIAALIILTSSCSKEEVIKPVVTSTKVETITFEKVDSKQNQINIDNPFVQYDFNKPNQIAEKWVLPYTSSFEDGGLTLKYTNGFYGVSPDSTTISTKDSLVFNPLSMYLVYVTLTNVDSKKIKNDVDINFRTTFDGILSSGSRVRINGKMIQSGKTTYQALIGVPSNGVSNTKMRITISGITNGTYINNLTVTHYTKYRL